VAHEITYRREQVAALLAGKPAADPKPQLPSTPATILAAHSSYRVLVHDLVAQTQAIRNDQEYRYVAALTEDLVKLAAQHLLVGLEEYMDDQRSAARAQKQG